MVNRDSLNYDEALSWWHGEGKIWKIRCNEIFLDLVTMTQFPVPFHFLIIYRMFGRIPIGILVAHFLLFSLFYFFLEMEKRIFKSRFVLLKFIFAFVSYCTFDNSSIINIVWTIVSHRCYLFGVRGHVIPVKWGNQCTQTHSKLIVESCNTCK